MDRSWMYNVNRADEKYLSGVEEFLGCALKHMYRNDETRFFCPCYDFDNVNKVTSLDECFDHLIRRGFRKNYTRWILHGEDLDESGATKDHESPRDNNDIGDDFEEDRIDDMMEDLQNSSDEVLKNLDQLLEDAEKPVYPGCDKYTKLSTVLKLMSLKVEGGLSDEKFTELLEFLQDLLPAGNVLVKSTYDAKKMICPFGTSYEKIHACPNDCILYRNEFKDLDNCPTCGESRYKLKKEENEGKTGSPAKVLWYLPIIPRLKRLFANEKDARNLRWHYEIRKKDEFLRHPADSPQWKTIDEEFPTFSNEPRNLRFALSTDGMNPFGSLSSKHSTWPVMLAIYNLPPWLCMKRKYIMLSLLISGPKQPGNDIDVYLAPLIEELKLLWDKGVTVFDAVAKENFTLRAMLFCTVSDFPAYGNLSGHVVRGEKACPICEEELDAPYLSNSHKNVYMSHRRFLSLNDPFREMKEAFNGETETRLEPIPLEARDVYERVKDIDLVFGKPSRVPEKSMYKKRSIFWDLPYWIHLPVRHCLDPMHLIKNVCENLSGLLGFYGKTKDGVKARKDMVNMGIRPQLAPVERGNSTYLPPACYTLSKKEKTILCESLHGIKVPYGYSSNISSRVSMKDLKLYGMKSHDCHVLMKQFLPVAIRSILPKEVRFAITRLCLFLNAICSKVIDPQKLDKLQADVVTTLCQLEMYFPPTFFDISEHLIVHLVREIKLCGPVFLRDMFSFERYMGMLKGHVKNRYRPEASIIEGVIAENAMGFCTDYLAGVKAIGVPTSRHEGRLLGKGTIGAKWVSIGLDVLNEAHFLVLQHLTEVHPYLEQHLRILRENNPLKSDRWLVLEHNKCFRKWFRERVLNQLSEVPNDVSDTVKWLAYGPQQKVRSFEGYDINGYCFYTRRQDKKSTMQNSGVTVVASLSEFSGANGRPIDSTKPYYGVIEDIWELDYTTFTVPLFKCEWADSRRGVKVDELGFTLVDFSKLGQKQEPFIMASQAKQVFYIADPANDGCSVVLQGKRHILGVEGVVDEEEYDEFDNIPLLYTDLPNPQVDLNLDTPYMRDDHNEGINIQKRNKKRKRKRRCN